MLVESPLAVFHDHVGVAAFLQADVVGRRKAEDAVLPHHSIELFQRVTKLGPYLRKIVALGRVQLGVHLFQGFGQQDDLVPRMPGIEAEGFVLLGILIVELGYLQSAGPRPWIHGS